MTDFARLARTLPASARLLLVDAIPGARASLQRAEDEERLDAIAKANGITREELDHRIRRAAS